MAFYKQRKYHGTKQNVIEWNTGIDIGWRNKKIFEFAITYCFGRYYHKLVSTGGFSKLSNGYASGSEVQ